MFAQLPMYQQQGKSALNHKLDKIQALSKHLGHPEKEFKSIHVAGTNGKGSSSHMLASVLQEAGYQVGLYTSPHLKDFRERIRINGNPVSEQFVVDFIQEHKSFLEANRLSFFEMTVGMAFQYFAEQELDIVVVEVGLGGRLDSTNIIVPEVSLITNIGFDHTDMLGNTLDKIAFEKGGIIKPGVPVVVSEYQHETAEVFKSIAIDRRSKLVFADRKKMPDYETSLLGNYQQKNIKGVVTVFQELEEFQVTEAQLRTGLNRVVENTGMMGRWQVLNRHPTIVCDTAHNSEGLQLVLAQLQRERYDTLHMVLGFVKDKDLEAILPLFPSDAHYYFCRPDIPRGLDVSILEDKAAKFELRGKSYSSVKSALMAAKEQAAKTDFIFIGGSNFTVAEVV